MDVSPKAQLHHRPIAADAKSRLRTRDTVVAVLALGLIAALYLIPLPLLFPDPSQTRLVLAGVLGGFVALSLASFVFRQMGAAVIYEESRPSGGDRMFRAHLEVLKRDAKQEERMSAWLAEKAPGRGPTLRLSAVDLRGAIIPGVDLTGAQLRGARLDEADLQGVTLRGSCLAKAVLRGADLRKADLRKADLRGTNFDHAQVNGATLKGAVFDTSTVWPTGEEALVELGAVDAAKVLGGRG